MTFGADIAPVAALLADPGRASIVSALLDGSALPAGELARMAGISPQTASSHFSKLVDGGLLRVRTQGRHRSYAIADAEIAHAVEALSAIAPLPPVRSLRASIEAQRLAAARTCYDHLAGSAAISIADALVERGDCERHESGFEVTPQGIAFFRSLDIDVPAILQAERPFVKTCIDWTQRRRHISGPIGAALLRYLLRLGHLRRGKHHRSIEVTQQGRETLHHLFDIDLPAHLTR